MLRIFLISITLSVTSLFGAPAGFAEEASTDGSPKNVILVVADGFGPSHTAITRITKGGIESELAIDRLPYTAVVKTYSADQMVTDSAAAMTAMVCGEKTVNGVLGQDATARFEQSAGKPLENLAEWGAKHGIVTGLITNTRVTHATPAALFAKHHDRNKEHDLARQALDSDLLFLVGGGAKFFDSGWHYGPRRVIREVDELMQATATPDQPVFGLIHDNHLPYLVDKSADPPRLSRLAKWGLEQMQKQNRPFFLVIESGRIDHALHKNWPKAAVEEMLELDNTIELILAHTDPENTLVLFTSDHETAGLTLNGYPLNSDSIWNSAEDSPQIASPFLAFSHGPGDHENNTQSPHGPHDRIPSAVFDGSGAHTGTDVVLYGWGDDADVVRGTLDNTDIYSLIKNQLRKNLSPN